MPVWLICCVLFVLGIAIGFLMLYLKDKIFPEIIQKKVEKAVSDFVLQQENKTEKMLLIQAHDIEQQRKITELAELDKQLNERVSRIKSLEEDYAKLLNQKKSSEVRLGKIAENMAPFFTCWPYDPNTFRFLGNPVDGIQFNENEIIFVEIKTGKARLSDSQKWIKKLVQEKKVSFVSFKIGENGVALEKEE